MKIFNLSLQRTATQSFYNFMLPYVKSIHFVGDNFSIPNNIEQYYIKYKMTFIDKDYISFSDFPIPLFAESILEEYPNSIFFCFNRNKDDWCKSVLSLLKQHKIDGKNTTTDSLFYQKYCQKYNIQDIKYKDLEIAYDNYYKLLYNYKEKINFIDMLDDPKNISKIISEKTNINFTTPFPYKDFLKNNDFTQ